MSLLLASTIRFDHALRPKWISVNNKCDCCFRSVLLLRFTASLRLCVGWVGAMAVSKHTFTLDLFAAILFYTVPARPPKKQHHNLSP